MSIDTEAINKIKHSSCALDILHGRFLKEVNGSVSPYIVAIINMSLLTGSVPAYFKNAIVQHFWKKKTL